MALVKRNAGGIALARLNKTNVEIASALGRSKPTVGRWISGERKPDEEDRKRIHEAFGIEPEAWDRSPKKAAPSAPVSPDPTPAPAAPLAPSPPFDPSNPEALFGSVLAMASRLQDQIDHELRDLEADREKGTATPAERTRRIREMTSAVKTLAEVTGQLDLGRAILKLPIWKRIEAEIFEGLRPFPDAAAALAARLEGLDRRLG